MMDLTFSQTENIYTENAIPSVVYQLPKEGRKSVLMRGGAIGKSGTPTDFQVPPSPKRDERGRFVGIVIPKESLEWLYVKMGLNSIKIAKVYGVGPQTILNKLKNYGMKRRTNREMMLSKKQLEKLYIEDGLSCAKIGELVGVRGGCIVKWLKKYNISARGPGEHNIGGTSWNKGLTIPRKFNLSIEELYDAYVDRRKSSLEIAKELGLSKPCVRYWLKKYGIPRRSVSEAAKLSWKKPNRIRKVGNPNKTEKWLDILIQRCFPDQWKFVGDGTKGVRIGGRVPDWVCIGGKRRVIELFGEPFHSNLAGLSMKVPYKRTYKGTLEHYKKHRYKCLIIWYEEIKYPDKVIEKIRNWGVK